MKLLGSQRRVNRHMHRAEAQHGKIDEIPVGPVGSRRRWRSGLPPARPPRATRRPALARCPQFPGRNTCAICHRPCAPARRVADNVLAGARTDRKPAWRGGRLDPAAGWRRRRRSSTGGSFRPETSGDGKLQLHDQSRAIGRGQARRRDAEGIHERDGFVADLRAEFVHLGGEPLASGAGSGPVAPETTRGLFPDGKARKGRAAYPKPGAGSHPGNRGSPALNCSSTTRSTCANARRAVRFAWR